MNLNENELANQKPIFYWSNTIRISNNYFMVGAD